MCGCNSVVECQPSKLFVAGSIPVTRSIKFVVLENSMYTIRALSLSSLSAGTRYELDYDEIGLILLYSKHRTIKAKE